MVMSKFRFIAAAGSLVALSVVFAAPASAYDNVNQRQHRQDYRIEQGRKNGSITWFEGLKLRAEQRRISHLEARFRSDGHLSPYERRTLSDLQQQASKHIRHERHDSWNRPYWLPRFGR
jgi:hypothetical protein